MVDEFIADDKITTNKPINSVRLYGFDNTNWRKLLTNLSGSLAVILDTGLRKSTIDDFGRLSVSNPFTLADYIFKYDLLPLLFDTTETNNGTVAHLPNESSVRLRCTTTDTDVAALTSRRYHRYQAGKAAMITMTAIAGAAKTNVRKRWGLFDANDGVFFEQTETDFAIVIRTSTSGSPVDTRVPQASFNQDVIDGTGISGFTIDLSKSNIFAIDFQWLGVGNVIFSIYDNTGNLLPVHQVIHVNVNTTVYMKTATLPVRYEIENTGAVGSNTDLIAICSTVISSGGSDPPESEFSGGNEAIITTTDANETFLVGFRPKATFQSIENRIIFLPKIFNFVSDLSSCIFRVYKNATISDGSWADIDTTNSGMEINTTATFSGGIPLDSSPVLQSGGGAVSKSSAQVAGLRKLALTLDAAGSGGAAADNLIITIQRLTATDVTAMASMKWGEAR